MKYFDVLLELSKVFILGWFVFAVLMPIILADSWVETQNIWDRWQTLNTGVLAFGAGMFVYWATKYNEKKELERKFFAVIPFIADVASELSTYLKMSATFINESIDNGELHQVVGGSFHAPPWPGSERLREVVELSSPHISDFVSKLIIELQIHKARMDELAKNNRAEISLNLLYYGVGVAVLHARVGRLFELSRNDLDSYDSQENYMLSTGDLKNSISVLNLNVDVAAEKSNISYDALDMILNNATKRANAPRFLGLLER